MYNNATLFLIISFSLCFEYHNALYLESNCISFYLSDLFNDGWGDDCIFQVSRENGFKISYSVTSNNNPRDDITYCFDPASSKDGDFIIAGVSGASCRFNWEVFWVAAESSGKSFAGNSKTIMKFIFLGSNYSHLVSLGESHNLLPYKSECSTCKQLMTTDAIMKEYPQKKQIQNQSFTDDILTRRLYDDIHSYIGYEKTTFDISSEDGLTRYFTGSLCNGNEYKQCNVTNILPQGTYIWRVSGAIDEHRNQIEWDYCGIKGKAMQELIFQINQENACLPLRLNSYGNFSFDKTKSISYHILSLHDKTSSSFQYSVGLNLFSNSHDNNSYNVPVDISHNVDWVLEGSLTTCANSNSFTKEEEYIFSSMLAANLKRASSANNIEADDVLITKWESINKSNVTKIRVYFVASVIPEDFGYNSLEDSMKASLAEYIYDYLQSASNANSLFIPLNKGLQNETNLNELKYLSVENCIDIESIQCTLSTMSEHNNNFANVKMSVDNIFVNISIGSIGIGIGALIGLFIINGFVGVFKRIKYTAKVRVNCNSSEADSNTSLNSITNAKFTVGNFRPSISELPAVVKTRNIHDIHVSKRERFESCSLIDSSKSSMKSIKNKINNKYDIETSNECYLANQNLVQQDSKKIITSLDNKELKKLEEKYSFKLSRGFSHDNIEDYNLSEPSPRTDLEKTHTPRNISDRLPGISEEEYNFTNQSYVNQIGNFDISKSYTIHSTYPMEKHDEMDISSSRNRIQIIDTIETYSKERNERFSSSMQI